MNNTRITKLWNNLKQEWSRLAPNVTIALHEAASEDDLQKLEETINAKLPEDFKAFYRVHNGQKSWEGVIDCQELLSIERIIDEWKVWKGLLDSEAFIGPDGSYKSEPREQEVKNDWWNPGWIPFTSDGAGNHLCVDLDPNPGGTYGQVIEMIHDDADRSLKASSLMTYIEHYTEKLKSDAYRYSDDYGGFFNKLYFND